MGKVRNAIAALLIGGSVLAYGHTALALPSMAGFPDEPRPPQGAPNVLIIMTDDVGFGASSTFGGPIPTPAFDALAADGVRFNRFHTTALCSPSRAALLTGRNPHSVGFGMVPDLSTGHPGYNSVLPKSAGTVAQALQRAGYRTAMFGKTHNTPEWQDGPAGPFTQLPNDLGFEYFYGFNGGWTDQFSPELIENRNAIEPPANDPTYILDRDLADHAVSWLQMQLSQSPDRPFLLYYATGTAHGPNQAPKEWIDRFKGRFDSGWDELRKLTYERQKRMGIIPADARLAPMPPGTPKWESLSPDEKRVQARYMEVYAAALAYCDDQIRRLIAELKRSGRYDNTIIFYLQGDNGASAEGGAIGAFNYPGRGGLPQTTAKNLARLDQLGGPMTEPIAPWGWTRAMNAPFPWNKSVASHLGGTRNGLVISWPGHLKGGSIVRSQFHHVIDIAPTIYEVTDVAPPKVQDGVEQRPLDGVSMAYAFKDAKATSPHRTQYFEVFGTRAYYEDGMLISSLAENAGKTPLTAEWELYDLKKDYSQTVNLAAKQPEVLARLVKAFDHEAEVNKVLPLQADKVKRVVEEVRPSLFHKPGRYAFYNSAYRYSASVFPDIRNRSWSLEADIASDRPADGALITQGNRFAGWGLAVIAGRPTFLYSMDSSPEGLFRLAAPDPLTPGEHKIGLAFAYDGGGMGKGGKVALKVDGKVVAEGRMERTSGIFWGPESVSIGRDLGAPLVDEYAAPFTYQGLIKRVDVVLD